MRIAYISDLHFEFLKASFAKEDLANRLVRSLENMVDRPDVVALLGDCYTFKDEESSEVFFDLVNKLNEMGDDYGWKVIYIPGNHELYGVMDPAYAYHLATQTKVVEHKGFTFVCGMFPPARKFLTITIFDKIADYRKMPIQSIYDVAHRNFTDLANLEEETKNVVFLTHFKPFISVESEVEKHFSYPLFSPLGTYFNVRHEIRTKPKAWLHGHSHEKYQFTYDGTVYGQCPAGYGLENAMNAEWGILCL